MGDGRKVNLGSHVSARLDKGYGVTLCDEASSEKSCFLINWREAYQLAREVAAESVKDSVDEQFLSVDPLAPSPDKFLGLSAMGTTSSEEQFSELVATAQNDRADLPALLDERTAPNRCREEARVELETVLTSARKERADAQALADKRLARANEMYREARVNKGLIKALEKRVQLARECNAKNLREIRRREDELDHAHSSVIELLAFLDEAKPKDGWCGKVHSKGGD